MVVEVMGRNFGVNAGEMGLFAGVAPPLNSTTLSVLRKGLGVRVPPGAPMISWELPVTETGGCTQKCTQLLCRLELRE